MTAMRSRRAWIPAAVASLTLTIGLVALQGIVHFAFDDATAPSSANASFADWMTHTYAGFFGPSAFDMSAGRTPLASLASLAVLLVVGFLGCWWAVRGIAPGSSILPPFLSIWMVLVITTTLAAFAAFAVHQGSSFQNYPIGSAVTDALATGSVFGVKWGWVASLLASLFWLVVRPRSVDPASVDPAQGQQPTPYDEPERDAVAGDPWHNERPESTTDTDNETQPIGRPVRESAAPQ